MSQGFRKTMQLPGASDKTDLTPPTRVDDQRNSRRALQITHLHQQFEDLKKKIKEVQNKNQKIIQKIHKAYNFKKKNAYTEQYIGGASEQTPVVYYDNRYDTGYSGTMSVDNKSNKSDQSQKQFRLQKRSTQLGVRKMQKNQKFNYSMQYGKTDPNILMQGPTPSYQQIRYQNQYQNQSPQYSQQLPPSYPPQQPPLPLHSQQSSSYTTIGGTHVISPSSHHQQQSQPKLDRKLVEELAQQKNNLEQELAEKQSQIYKLQNLFRNNNRNVKGLIQNALQQFYENVLQKNIIAIQKSFKKYEQKMKNLKKVALVAKDKQQDKKSSRLLQEGRERRSQSRSRRNSPPRQFSNSTFTNSRETVKILNNSRTDIKDQTKSRSKLGRQQAEQKSKKQFQQIASKYQQLIKNKTQQIDRLDKKYKVKERECYELKMRVDVLQKRLAQQQKKSNSRTESMSEQLEGVSKKRVSTQSNLLADIYDPDENQIAKLNKKIEQFQQISNEKSSQISNLQNLLSSSQNKTKQIYADYQQNLSKTKNKYQQQQQKHKKQFQKIINQKCEQAGNYKNLLLASQKKFLQKQCDYYSLESKMKKNETLLSNKDKKIQQLQKLLADNCPTDRSGMLNSSVFNPLSSSTTPSPSIDSIRKLKQQIDNLQSQLEASKTQIFTLTKKNTFYKTKLQQLENSNSELKKQMEGLSIENQQLKINVNMNNISAVVNVHNGGEGLGLGGDNENSRDDDQIGNSLSAIDDAHSPSSNTNNNNINNNNNNKKNIAQIENLTQKIQELTKQKQQWYQKYQKTKAQTLQKQSQSIKLKSYTNFLKKQFEDLESTISKLKLQNQQYKNENKELQSKIQKIETDFQIQRQQFKNQINDIESRWAQFEQQIKKSGMPGLVSSEMDRSQKSSVVSYSHNNTKNHLQTQNQYLTVKLKQAQSQIQTQKAMEQKIIEQYQLVMEQYKIQLKNKGEHIKSLKQQIQQLSNKVYNLNMRLQMANKNQAIGSGNGGNGVGARREQKNQLFQRLDQLQAQLKETKEINSKLTDMEGQLFEQIKIKEEERAELYQELSKKQHRIQQLEQIVQIRAGEMGNPYSSHMSQSTHKRQSIKSQSSLKYSSHSQILKKSRLLNSGKNPNASDQRAFDLQLSDAGSQFFEQPSQISNISEFFQKQELPYQKIKIKRQDQIKLFQKTSSYIKSLKKAIDQKNKKIKLLQKKIQSLKASELVRKQLGLDIQIKQDRYESSKDRLEADDTFKDYQSVQLEYRRGGHLRRYKQLEHDTKLVMEQNNLLIQQIETLQEQLLKAQEQENSLVKIKDLYKQQIKKLIKKNEQQTKQFEQQLKNQKRRVQDSESIHNIEHIKQLFIKIIQITALKFTQQNMTVKRKEEKRKEVEEYVKVMSNILKIDGKVKDGLLKAFQKA